MLLIKAIAGLLVLGAMGGTAYLMKQYTGTVKDLPGTMMERQREIELSLKKKAEEGVRSDNEPGEKAFQRARELLAMESMAEAEEKLKYIVSFYPSAKSATEARHILGEINMDRLLDPEWKEGKRTITVQRGDSYSAIIRKNKTTMDSMTHLSKLRDTDARGLRPGQKLLVMPLDLRISIDLRRKNLTLWKEGDFVKEYPLLKVEYEHKGKDKHLQVGSIRGWYNDEYVSVHSPHYRAATKTIILSDKSLAIRALPSDPEQDLGRGFYLSPVDMEELPLVLRPGNDVEIKN
ncbi:LysM peptidoglycan-binding domain-containing protein [Verrucomicrobiaceae bacterium R5-34]|uniref:LysM peptidoglycan-binding domain-containing protein n=1 Tax=Oceaniferula flava TaxID=2800421 RepID=A0AAE2SC86_9BACT|nr:LysM peptidoglycan-binding domain-containing protein [Oceaniferula flavus]MBK1832322.1 LysM peptidoglycan-binding domain-containing protein [Verrucomicrobiaceae bacterium R5-34]MBK1854357.1 LysM peptidoglycan-binding domain-containing protein [Oceaniferula flavus]MBM1135663.1 LysM peptidoglycan-binding domain-containing protein [Oceaniferula flavus]